MVQILLNIAVKVSLKEKWHLSKEVDYSLKLLVFVLGQSVTLFLLLCILNHPVIQRWSYIFVHFALVFGDVDRLSSNLWGGFIEFLVNKRLTATHIRLFLPR